MWSASANVLRVRVEINLRFLAQLFLWISRRISQSHNNGAMLKRCNENIRKQEQAKNVKSFLREPLVTGSVRRMRTGPYSSDGHLLHKIRLCCACRITKHKNRKIIIVTADRGFILNLSSMIFAENQKPKNVEICVFKGRKQSMDIRY